MATSDTIALIGGSGLGPWAWERVTPILAAHGYHVLTPQLRGVADGSTGAEAVTLGDWVEDVSAALAGHDGTILVAHSFAGYLAAAVAERHPAAVRRIVFLDAVLPRPGASWFDVMGPEVTAFMTSLARAGAVPWFSRAQLDQLHPRHSITDADFAWMQSHVAPQPINTYSEPAIATPLRSIAPAAAYVRCVDTDPPSADLTNFSDWECRTLASGHWPMITNPADTAQTIHELAGAPL